MGKIGEEEHQSIGARRLLPRRGYAQEYGEEHGEAEGGLLAGGKSGDSLLNIGRIPGIK